MTVFTLNISDKSFQIDLDESFPNEKTVLEYLKGGAFYEPDVSSMFLRLLREGDCVIDVGANIGYFTTLAAALVGPLGKVVCFEPDEANLKRLNANLALNAFTHVTVIKKPVSNKVEEVNFFINNDDSGGNALWDPALFPGNTKSEANPQPVGMMTTTLDEEVSNMDLERLKLIKVDTEGADQRVLEGAKNLLQDVKVPFVISELHEFGLNKLDCTQQSFRGYMEGLGYSTFALFFNGSLPKFIPPKTTLSSGFILNLLFTTPDLLSAYWETETIDPR